METTTSQKSGSSSRSASVPSNTPELKSRTRKRNDSLRKAALLGTGGIDIDRGNRAASSKQKSPSKNSAKTSNTGTDQTPPFVSHYVSESGSDNENTNEKGVQSNSELHERNARLVPSDNLLDPFNSAAEDEAKTRQIPGSFQRSSSSSSRGSTNLTEATSNVLQPLSSHIDEWDYSSTERWGWMILFSTWIIFVVGIGSCFGVWSWAWDVGETPYAPPELEDDPTLPIVGYYPALIILTGVMCWVWVIVAWVGMKYFKHAKIQGEDT